MTVSALRDTLLAHWEKGKRDIHSRKQYSPMNSFNRTFFAIGFTFAAILFTVILGIMGVIIMHGGIDGMNATVYGASSLPLFANAPWDDGSSEIEGTLSSFQTRSIHLRIGTVLRALDDGRLKCASVSLENALYDDLKIEVDSDSVSNVADMDTLVHGTLFRYPDGRMRFVIKADSRNRNWM